MNWQKYKIRRGNGELVDAQTPIIISASRSTDIPAFYADWFFSRLKTGYSAWRNPFTGTYSFISYQNTRFIVFWSKNPKPLLEHIDYLKERRINCYIQFTLNDYVKEGLEKNVPNVGSRIDTFKALVDKLGKGHVVWRFDPLILTDQISEEDLLEKISYIGDKLKGYTDKMVFSFVDISSYKKVKRNLDFDNIHYREWDDKLQMSAFASHLVELNHKWNYTLATCGEGKDLDGVQHNKCIDDDLIIKIAWKDKTLMDFLKVKVFEYNTSLFSEPLPPGAILLDRHHYALKTKNNKDHGQREFCGCIISKDIGQYNTCPHLCEYCYANTTKEMALANWRRHKENKFDETITGR